MLLKFPICTSCNIAKGVQSELKHRFFILQIEHPQFDFSSEWLRFSLIQLNRSDSIFPNPFPFSDWEYSTLSGTSAKTSLFRNPTSTNSSNLRLRVVDVMLILRFNSLKRIGVSLLLKVYNISRTCDLPSRMIVSWATDLRQIGCSTVRVGCIWIPSIDSISICKYRLRY